MAVTKRKNTESEPATVPAHKEEVNLDTLDNLERVRAVRAELRKKADAQIFSALLEVGFNKNHWHFDPKYVRYMLIVAVAAFGIFTTVSYFQRYTTLFGSYFWMFFCYGLIFDGLLYFWYNVVEHGGGKYLFSAGWRDSYLLTDSTSSNYLVTVYIGPNDVVKAVIPYSKFELTKDGEVDIDWLADELEEQFDVELIEQK